MNLTSHHSDFGFIISIVRRLQCERSKAYSCLYYIWTESGALLVWFSWVDDCVIAGPNAERLELKKHIMREVECEDGGG
jgi:hypothetical protein